MLFTATGNLRNAGARSERTGSQPWQKTRRIKKGFKAQSHRLNISQRVKESVAVRQRESGGNDKEDKLNDRRRSHTERDTAGVSIILLAEQKDIISDRTWSGLVEGAWRAVSALISEYICQDVTSHSCTVHIRAAQNSCLNTLFLLVFYYPCSALTCQMGSLSSGKIWKYFCASWTGGSVCSFKLVHVWTNFTRFLNVYRPRRSLP